MTKKQRLAALLAGGQLIEIGEPEWKRLLAELSPISESYLRRLLRETGIPIMQPFAGIAQANLEDLERSLIDLEREYTRAREAGDRGRAQLCRNTVIQAKDHARLAARNVRSTEEKRKEKEEMVQWMLVWLDNPAVFEAWVNLRKKIES